MTKYRGWMYNVRQIRRGFWTYDLCREPGAPWDYSEGEVHGNERDARASARNAIDHEVRRAA